MPDVNTMTVEQCMDWVAEHVLGWRPPGFAYQTDAEHSLVMREWSRPVDGGVQMHEYGKHPCGTPTIDSAARLMRELCPEWAWHIGSGTGSLNQGKVRSVAYESASPTSVEVVEANDECLSRWRLLVSCLMTQKKEKA